MGERVGVKKGKEVRSDREKGWVVIEKEKIVTEQIGKEVQETPFSTTSLVFPL